MRKELVINRILAIDKEQSPGNESRDEIGSNIFKYL
jgi:hypothetical protein